MLKVSGGGGCGEEEEEEVGSRKLKS